MFMLKHRECGWEWRGMDRHYPKFYLKTVAPQTQEADEIWLVINYLQGHARDFRLNKTDADRLQTEQILQMFWKKFKVIFNGKYITFAFAGRDLKFKPFMRYLDELKDLMRKSLSESWLKPISTRSCYSLFSDYGNQSSR